MPSSPPFLSVQTRARVGVLIATTIRRADLLHATPDQQARIAVRLEEDTVWLPQRQMAEQFQAKVQRAEAGMSYQGILEDCH